MLTKMIETLKRNPRTIVFTEGTDYRILDAADKLTGAGILDVILLGTDEEVMASAKAGNYNIEKCTIVDPSSYPGTDEMAVEMAKLRKGKMTEEQCREALSKSNYFGTMLVKMGKADCLLGGAAYSTADTVRPALQLIKTKPGNKIVSSCFILVRGDEKIAMGDCAINIDPSEDDLVEIAIESANTAKIFGIDPKVAMLSYSTLGSGKGPSVTKVANATKKIREAAPDLAVEGEIQFDASVSPDVAGIKCPGSPVAGQANTFIFPDINAGNIGYKIASRLGGYTAVGPVLQGLNAPINDLSRGCTAEEVYSMAIVTAALSVPPEAAEEEEQVDMAELETIVRTVVEAYLAAQKLKK
ncbi:MAG: phosphate acetyltransferase [Clostridiales bacterium]|nr:phosphate acetyltransferase [Clostridiales bacterium]